MQGSIFHTKLRPSIRNIVFTKVPSHVEQTVNVKKTYIFEMLDKYTSLCWLWHEIGIFGYNDFDERKKILDKFL